MTRVRSDDRKLHTFDNVTRDDRTYPDIIRDLTTGQTLIAAPDTDSIPDSVHDAFTDDDKYDIYTGDHRPLPYDDASYGTVVGFHGTGDLYGRARPFFEYIRVVKQNHDVLQFTGWYPNTDKAELNEIFLLDSRTDDADHLELTYGTHWTVNPGQTELLDDLSRNPDVQVELEADDTERDTDKHTEQATLTAE